MLSTMPLIDCKVCGGTSTMECVGGQYVYSMVAAEPDEANVKPVIGQLDYRCSDCGATAVLVPDDVR